MGSESVETDINILVTTVDLRNIADLARALCRHGRKQQRDTGTYVGRQHAVGLESVLMVKADDHSTVRIAEHYLRAHVDKPVDEEKTALEHLLMYQHRSATLRGDNEHHRQQVGGQSGPRSVGHIEYRTVEGGFYLIDILSRNVDVVTAAFESYSEPLETVGGDSEIMSGSMRWLAPCSLSVPCMVSRFDARPSIFTPMAESMRQSCCT